MSKDRIHLEKYKVAPAPSRDYYGIKIENDEVKLLHWPIRQRPHKPPLTRKTSFSDWKRDTTLQNDISFVFGDSWLDHINNLISNKKSLLTLSKGVIIKILNYLTPGEIIRLFRISKTFYETLNTEDTWEVIFKKIRGPDYHRAQSKYGMAYGWKQLLKETQDLKIGSSTSINKNLKITSSFDKSLGNPKKSLVEPKKTLEKGESLKNSQKIPRTIIQPQKPVLPSKKSSERQINRQKVALNVVNLKSSELFSKSEVKIDKNDEKRRNFKANPAPRVTHKPGVRKSELKQMKFSSLRNPITKSSDTSLDELVKKTLRGIDTSNRELISKFDWLSEEKKSVDDVIGGEVDEEIGDDYDYAGWDKEFCTSGELKSSKDCGTEGELFVADSRSRPRVSTQSVGVGGLKERSGFNPLNSDYIRAGLNLKPKKIGAMYTDIRAKLMSNEKI